MRKIYFLLVCMLMLSFADTNAQCTGTIPGRYTDYVFPEYDVSTVKYGTYTADSMDIYEPRGDAATARPLLILAHGGSFIGGSRRLNSSQTDPCVDTFCLRFVRRGYVTVSIDYRLGSSILTMIGAESAADQVAKAISDGKAAIRYLVQNRTTYRIDTNNIFIGGNSAGAVLFMHAGYIEDIADCSPLILTALNNNGGLDGDSGNPGYTTKCKGVINMAGALNTTNVIHNNAIPSVNCHGDIDGTVPYDCGLPLGGICPDTLCGLGALEPVYVAKNVYHMSRVFPAQDHVPWNGDPGMMNTVDSITREFLYSMVCTNVASVNDVHFATEVALFPNPATEVLNLSAGESVNNVIMYDQTGRTVLQVDGINRERYEINTSRLAKGMYFVRVTFSDKNNIPVTKKIVIQ